MRLSLDTIGYGGYFTASGEQLPLEDAVRRAAQFGYDGLLSAEQCSPIIRGHKLGTVKLVDERYVASLAFLKGLLLKLGAYTGHKKSPA